MNTFKAENGSVYVWWNHKQDAWRWEPWPIRRCLGMARQYRGSSRPTAEPVWWQGYAAKYRKNLLTAMLEARRQRQPIQLEKVA